MGGQLDSNNKQCAVVNLTGVSFSTINLIINICDQFFKQFVVQLHYPKTSELTTCTVTVKQTS